MYSLPMYPLKAVLSEINVELYLFTKIDYSVSFFLVKIYKFWTRFQVWSQIVLSSMFLGLARQAGKIQTD